MTPTARQGGQTDLSPINRRGQTGWIEVISGSMFSGEANIYEARCRRCYEPPQEGQREK